MSRGRGRPAGSPSPGVLRRIFFPLAALVATASIALGLWLERPRAQAPNFLLFTLCSVRADRLGAYGHGATPNIDRLASEGVVFDRAWTSSTFTLPSHATLLTGLYPTHIGVTASTDVLGTDFPTLPEILRLYGWRTMAWAPVASRASFRRGEGLERGFDAFFEGGETELPIVGAIAAGAGPWFALVHFKHAHPPYLAGRVGEPDARITEWQRLATLERDPSDPLDPDRWMVEQMKADPGLKAEVDRNYDGALRAADAAVGEVLDALRAAGELEHSYVIVAGDHGESLGEHDHIGHQGFLQPEVLRVPLIVAGPGLEARRVADDVGLVDLLATVLNLAGATVPARQDGQDLGPLLRGERLPPRALLAQSDSWRSGAAGWEEALMRRPYWLEWRGDDARASLWREGDGWARVEEAETLAELLAERRRQAGVALRKGAPAVSDEDKAALRRDGYW